MLAAAHAIHACRTARVSRAPPSSTPPPQPGAHACSTSQLNLAVGIVGALVMPHNIYLHSALVQSRKIDTSHAGAKREAILYNAIESGASLAVTVVINLFVMSVFAVGFHGSVDVDQVGLSTAGRCAAETCLGPRCSLAPAPHSARSCTS